MLLIFIHEMGHYIEARRERLNPQWPVFIPFLGAYVKHTVGRPWQTTRVAIAGPILGGIGALAFFIAGEATGSDLLVALGFFGFFLNLFNLLPFGIFDGGAVWRSTRLLWYGGAATRSSPKRSSRAPRCCSLLGAYLAYVPQNRL